MTQLGDDLAMLGLRHTADSLDDLLAHAAKRRLSHTQLLEHIASLEIDDRARRSLERRMSRSRLGRFKAVADFDWSWPKRVDRDSIEAILRLDFLDHAGNVVLVAPQGLGKTTLAKNIGHHAVLAGHSVLFVTAAEMLLDLSGQESARALERRLRHYVRPALLIVDEIGYLSYDSRNADLLFQIISRRYEHKSVVLTTNLAFADWPTIFPNATSATALIDRLVHHAEVIALEGDSYRRREAESAKSARRRAKRRA
jgi:DNA replication protein DnaC